MASAPPPWNLDLCLGHWQRALVPFKYFVKTKPLDYPTTRPVFPFLRLPIDIRLIVYEHCDAPTLFQLMRTSSEARGHSAKLFWANHSMGYWYHCSDYSMFEYWPHQHIIIQHCPEFAQHITRIEIDLGRLEMHFATEGEDRDTLTRPRADAATKAQDFWTKVTRFFPAILTMVLTGCTPGKLPPPDEPRAAYVTIETVVDYAPSHIVVHLAFYNFMSKPIHHTLWHIEKNQQPRWTLIDDNWRPTRVLLPSRNWPVSPLGDLSRFMRRSTDMVYEMGGLDALKIESYARYANNGAIYCPRLDCDATFKERPSWTLHLYESRHGFFDRHKSKKDEMLELLCYKNTPAVEQAALAARQQRISEYLQNLMKCNLRVGYAWGPPKSKQRQLFEEKLGAELEGENNFALGGLPQTLDSPLGRYEDTLHMLYSRGHVYHGCPRPGEKHICYSWEDGIVKTFPYE